MSSLDGFAPLMAGDTVGGMASFRPEVLTPAQLRARRDRVARAVGFVGRIEYRHVFSQTGGAQYGQGVVPTGDLLTVYAEAFERDADPADFSLGAIMAHERGHQLVARHPRLSRQAEGISLATEEILASVVGALICPAPRDKDSLLAKATIELINHGDAPEVAVRRLRGLKKLLEELL
jgi:hypothetical protein